MTEEREYPRWVHCPGTIPGKKSALVNDAAAEAAQLAAWGVPTAPNPSNALIDYEYDTGRVVTSPEPTFVPRQPVFTVKQYADDLPALRVAYKTKFGKRAFPGWNADEITKRMEAN